jgi:hypothetical protein
MIISGLQDLFYRYKPQFLKLNFGFYTVSEPMLG